MIDEALRNWVGISGAATAFIIYFGLQALQTSAAAGLGLWTLMTVGAVAYALKDRAKELTRQWLSGKLSHLYATACWCCASRAIRAGRATRCMRARESWPGARRPGRSAQPRHRRRAARGHAPLQAARAGDAAQGAHAAALRAAQDRLPLRPRSHPQPRLDDSVKRVPVPGGQRRALRGRAAAVSRADARCAVATAAGVERRRCADRAQSPRHRAHRAARAGQRRWRTARR